MIWPSPRLNSLGFVETVWGRRGSSLFDESYELLSEFAGWVLAITGKRRGK